VQLHRGSLRTQVGLISAPGSGSDLNVDVLGAQVDSTEGATLQIDHGIEGHKVRTQRNLLAVASGGLGMLPPQPRAL
jgi:hypothetical protein